MAEKEKSEKGKGSLKTKIEEILDSDIRPGLQIDGGDVEFVAFEEKSGTVKVRLRGHCAGCPMSQMTVKNFVEARLKAQIPEVKKIESIK